MKYLLAACRSSSDGLLGEAVHAGVALGVVVPGLLDGVCLRLAVLGDGTLSRNLRAPISPPRDP